MKQIILNNKTIEITDERFKELEAEFCKKKEVKRRPIVMIQPATREDWATITTIELVRTTEEAEAKLAYINALAEINEYIEENDLALENVDWSNSYQKKMVCVLQSFRKYV